MKETSQTFFLNVSKKVDRVARVLYRDWMDRHSYSLEDLKQAIFLEFLEAIKVDKKSIERTTAFLVSIGNNLKMNIHKKKDVLLVDSGLSRDEEVSVVRDCETPYDLDSASDKRQLLEALLRRTGVTGSRATLYIDHAINGLSPKQIAERYNMTQRGAYYAIEQIRAALMQTADITIRTAVMRIRTTGKLKKG